MKLSSLDILIFEIEKHAILRSHSSIVMDARAELSTLQNENERLISRVALLEGIIFRNCTTMDMDKEDEMVALEIYRRNTNE